MDVNTYTGNKKNIYVPGIIFGVLSLLFASYYSYLLIISATMDEATAAPVMKAAYMPWIYIFFAIIFQFTFPVFCFASAAGGAATFKRRRLLFAVFAVLLAELLIAEYQLVKLGQIFTAAEDLMLSVKLTTALVGLTTAAMYCLAAGSVALAAAKEWKGSRRCILLAILLSLLQAAPYYFYTVRLVMTDIRIGNIYMWMMIWYSVRENGAMIFALLSLYALAGKYIPPSDKTKTLTDGSDCEEAAKAQEELKARRKKIGNIVIPAAFGLFFIVGSILCIRQADFSGASADRAAALRTLGEAYRTDIPTAVHPVAVDSMKQIKFTDRDVTINIIGSAETVNGEYVIVADMENKSNEAVYIYCATGSRVNGYPAYIDFRSVIEAGETARVKIVADGAVVTASQNGYIKSAYLKFQMNYGKNLNKIDYGEFGEAWQHEGLAVFNGPAPAAEPIYGTAVYSDSRLSVWYQGRMDYMNKSYLVFYLWTDDDDMSAVKSYSSDNKEDPSSPVYVHHYGKDISGENWQTSSMQDGIYGGCRAILLDEIDALPDVQDKIKCDFSYTYIVHGDNSSKYSYKDVDFSFVIDPNITFPAGDVLIMPN